MASEKEQLQNKTVGTTNIFCETQLRKRLTALTFVINLFYFAAAYLHLITANLCKNYQNLVKNSNPIYNFKAVIEPLQKSLIIFAMIDIGLLIVNAIIILFGIKTKHYGFYIIPLLLTALGMAVSMGVPIIVMTTVKEWNNINKSSFNMFSVYSTVFVGDLNGFQTLFRLEILIGFLVFFTANIYTFIYWAILMREQCIISKEVEIEPQKMVGLNEDSSIAKEKSSVLQEKYDQS